MVDYTDEQRAIIETDVGPGETLKVIAGAGSGKTTVFEGYSKKRMEKSFLYVAYNKSVQTEAQRRFAHNTESKTIHSLAYEEFGRSYAAGGRNIASSVGYKPIKIQFGVRIEVAALIRQTLENFLMSADPKVDIKHAAYSDKVRVPSGSPCEFLASKAADLWDIMKKRSNKFISMTHDGYLKLFQLSVPRLRGGIILGDEAQDTNEVTISILEQQLAFGKGVLFCGDPYQQIYSWRGAVDALQKIVGEPMYLTQSFRFGKSIAAYANALLEMYFSPDFRLQGLGGPDSVLINKDLNFEPNGNAAMLFRTNARIFIEMFEMANRGVIFHYCGNLMELLDFVMDVFYLKYGARDRMTERSRAKSFDSYGEFVMISELDAELASIRKIVDEHDSRIPKIVEAIKVSQAEFAEHADVTLSTAHKAKGLEWDRVILSDDFFDIMDPEKEKMFSLQPGAESNIMDVIRNPEEINLLYVAMTRAKKVLELPAKMIGLLDCYEKNKETGDYFLPPRRIKEY